MAWCQDVREHGLFLDLGVFGMTQMHISNAVQLLDGGDRVDLAQLFDVNRTVRCRVLQLAGAGPRCRCSTLCKQRAQGSMASRCRLAPSSAWCGGCDT